MSTMAIILTCTRSACNKFDASSERSAGTDPSLWQFPAVLCIIVMVKVVVVVVMMMMMMM